MTDQAAERVITSLDNNPPSDIDVLQDRLASQYKGDLGRSDRLIDALKRVPGVIVDDEVNQKATDFIKQLEDHMKILESQRKLEKRPLDGLVATVQGFFTRPLTALKSVKDTVEERQTVYLKKKEREIREAAEAEAKTKREEAARLLELAQSFEQRSQISADAGKQAMDMADEAESKAMRAEQIAGAPSIELTRTRGSYGGVTSLKSHWTHEIIDRDKIPLDKLRPYFTSDHIDQALRAYIKANKAEVEAGRAQLDGIRFFDDKRV